MKKLKITIFFIFCLLLCSANSYAKENEVKISFAGDCTLGTYKGQGAGNRFDEVLQKEGYDYFFSNVKDVFLNDDLTIVNLEGPLTNETPTAVKEFPIKCHPDAVNILKNSGIEVVSLANNHTLDCSKKGLLETKEILKTNNINYSINEDISIIDKNNVRVAFLAYKGFSYDETILKNIKDTILNLKTESSVDIIIIMFHWGEERHNESNSTQENLGHFCIDNGADIVVGAHPHVIQGIEKYKGKIIAYSLSNFCFGANKNPKDKDTFILQQTFLKDGSYLKTEIIPCTISSVSNKNDYRPTKTDNHVLERLKTYSKKYPESIF